MLLFTDSRTSATGRELACALRAMPLGVVQNWAVFVEPVQGKKQSALRSHIEIGTVSLGSVEGGMGGWMNGWWVDGWPQGWMEGWVDGLIGGGWLDGRTDGWMDGCMAGWMD